MSYRQFAANAVANASQDRRINFIRLTYIHLGGAILSFAALCGLFLKVGVGNMLLRFIGAGTFNMLLFFGAFMFGGYLAEKWSRNHSSMQMQYLGLFVYTLVEALFFAPILQIAATYSDPSVIPSAGIMTGVVFAGLTGITMVTKKDFSFLGGILQVVMLSALGLIICSWLFGFKLGVLFSMAMVVIAGGYILYETSAVMRHYPETAYVGASLRLFSAVALLFFYILRIFMSRD